MQEINLLQNKLKDNTHNWEKGNRGVVVVLVLVLIVELVAGGMLYFLTRNAEESKIALDRESAEIQSQLNRMTGQMIDAKGFQAQAKNIETLLQNHLAWTSLMTSIESSTFLQSRYLSMSAEPTGAIHVEGTVNSYAEIGKVLLALETNEDFESVKLLSTAPSTGTETGVSFSLDITAKPETFLKQQ